jgi:hypothetical protein
MTKLISAYRWFIGNEKPFLCLAMINIGVIVHFTSGFLFAMAPIHWTLGGMCVGGCIGFLVGLPFYFIILGLQKCGIIHQ